MSPIKIAVIIETEIMAGGGHQQALNAALMINKIDKTICQPIFITINKENIRTLREYDIESIHFKISKISKSIMYFKSKIFHPRLLRIVNILGKHNPLEKFLINLNIDLLYFTSPSNLPRFLNSFNFIYTVWDLCHRDNLEFPEVRENRVFEQRESKYKTILPRALMILVDSELGKYNVINRYGIDENRLIVMPFSPANKSMINDTKYKKDYIDIKNKYGLSCDYIFYPAQFWSHKNHVFILDGIKSLEEKKNVKIGAIFSGSDKGNEQYIKSEAKKRGIIDRVIFAGFVPNNHIPFLYKQSLALVMPTYFGPTNLPPMEAIQLGTPVLCGEIPGAKDQLGEGVVYLDLSDVNTFLESVLQLYDASFNKNIIEKGYSQLKKINQHRNISENNFIQELQKYQKISRCWSTP